MTPAEREHAILAHRWLVEIIAHDLTPAAGALCTFDDLVSEGFLGLIYAVDDYDAARGASLATYARPRIHGAIIDSLRGIAGTVSAAKKTKKRAALFSDIEDEAYHLNTAADSPEDLARQAQRELALEWAIAGALNDRERQVLQLRYRDEWKQIQIARAFGVSESRIWQLHRGALRKLRAWLIDGRREPARAGRPRKGTRQTEWCGAEKKHQEEVRKAAA